MKRTCSLIAVLVCIVTLVACTKKADSFADLDYNSINKIQVISSMGNPAYGADSKIITDENEIKNFVITFNGGVIGEKIPDDEVGIGFTSKYVFYNNDGIVAEYQFNANNTKVIALEEGYYTVDYGDEADSPYKLYKQSKSTEIVVGLDGNEMDLIRYNENTYVKSELSAETIEWLGWYNSLTDDEKSDVSDVPEFGDAKPLEHNESEILKLVDIGYTQDAETN